MKRHRWLRILLAAFVCLQLVIIVVSRGGMTFISVAYIAPHWGTFKEVAARLPAQRVAVQKQGLPLTPADMKPAAPLSPDQNAASLYQKAFAQLDLVSKDDQDTLADYLKPPNRSQERGKEVRRQLAVLAPALTLTEQATRRPHLEWERSWTGMDTDFPGLAKVRTLSRCFALRSVIEAEDGKPLEALKSVAIGARIGQQVGQEPFVIPGLVQIALRTLQHRQFIAVLKQYGDQPQVLAAAHETLGAFGNPQELRHHLRGEVFLGAQEMENLVTDPDSFMEVLKKTPFYTVSQDQRRLMCDAWLVRLLEFWQEAFPLLPQKGSNEARDYQDFKNLLDKEENRFRNDPTYMMSSTIVPVYGSIVTKFLQSEAEARLRATALALLQERSRTGKFPAELPGATPSSRDPFNSQSLRYKRVGDGARPGFLLYSVGANRKDDGGSTSSTSSSSSDSSDTTGPDDLAIAYP